MFPAIRIILVKIQGIGDQGDGVVLRDPQYIYPSASTVHSIVCDVDSLVCIGVISYVSSIYIRVSVYVI